VGFLFIYFLEALTVKNGLLKFLYTEEQKWLQASRISLCV